MHSTATILFAVAGFAALIDWWGVATARLSVEFVAKPMVVIALIGTALAVEANDSVVRGIVIVALGASLVGDVVLMAPDVRFVAGLFAFLFAQGLYIAAFAGSAEIGPSVAAAILVVGIGFGVVPELLASARAHGLMTAVVVALHIGVVSLMAILAAGTGVIVAAIGGALFLASHVLFGWNRLVAAAPGGRVLVHVTYHLAQVSIVLWLAA